MQKKGVVSLKLEKIPGGGGGYFHWNQRPCIYYKNTTGSQFGVLLDDGIV